jgi:hypothetical protein
MVDSQAASTLCDLLGAVQNGVDRGAADQVGQAADHSAGAPVAVLGQPDQGALGVLAQGEDGLNAAARAREASRCSVVP